MTTADHPGPEASHALLTVGQVARAAGVTANAVRFYERYGVITGHRNSGNARRFTVDAICRINSPSPRSAWESPSRRAPTSSPASRPCPAISTSGSERVKNSSGSAAPASISSRRP
ncbi:MerR family DNA-binding transcriptional regulator [Nonomuraea sp. NPDC049480]|uniref:MerR family DNA-binding transcriptional regulator n=1 Tax=Nonomuraea sp. NPDC049480 TaxID=3364353 RepID=UPI0037B1ED9D